MKRSTRYFLIALFGLPLLALGGFQGYLLWPHFFPKYARGTCVEDSEVHRIHEIIGDDDWLKRGGVPTRIVKRGVAAPGMYLDGSEDRIDVNDPAIHPVPCP